MSSARKRRAEIQANPPAPNKMVPPPAPASGRSASAPASTNLGAGNQAGLTLQQIINITDRRLTALESSIQKVGTVGTSSAVAAAPSLAQETIDEFYSRFDILVAEVAELKDTVMKLQTYTMEVNRVLFEERKKTSESDEDETAVADATDAEDTEATATEIEADETAAADSTVAASDAKRGGSGRRVRGGGIRVNL